MKRSKGDWWARSVAVFAFLVSIRSCQISQQALEHSQRTFVIEQRPYVNVEVVKHKGTDDYLHVSKQSDRITLEVAFEISNQGKAPAKDIHVPEHIAIPKSLLTEGKPVQLTLPPIVTLGPGQKDVLVARFGIGRRSKSVDGLEQDYQEFLSGKMGVTTQLVLLYKSEPDSLSSYKTLVSYEVKNGGARLIRREER